MSDDTQMIHKYTEVSIDLCESRSLLFVYFKVIIVKSESPNYPNIVRLAPLPC